MTDTSEQLLPCAFCGGKAQSHVGMNAFEDVEISCPSCAAVGPNCDDGFCREDNLRLATAHWNTRTPRQLDAEVVARVQDAMQISKEHLDKCVAARGFVHTDMFCTLRLSDVKAMLEALA